VPVSIRDLIRKPGDEVVGRAVGFDSPILLCIFGQKTHHMAVRGEQPVLGDRWPAEVSGNVAEKCILGCAVLDPPEPQAVVVYLEQFH
jgi:hypothetical protein